MNKFDEGSMTITVKAIHFGLTRTFPFTKQGIADLNKIIDFLESQCNRLTEGTVT